MVGCKEFDNKPLKATTVSSQGQLLEVKESLIRKLERNAKLDSDLKKAELEVRNYYEKRAEECQSRIRTSQETSEKLESLLESKKSHTDSMEEYVNSIPLKLKNDEKIKNDLRERAVKLKKVMDTLESSDDLHRLLKLRSLYYSMTYIAWNNSSNKGFVINPSEDCLTNFDLSSFRPEAASDYLWDHISAGISPDWNVFL